MGIGSYVRQARVIDLRSVAPGMIMRIAIGYGPKVFVIYSFPSSRVCGVNGNIDIIIGSINI